LRPVLPDLRNLLRNATADSHQRLDNLVSQLDLSRAEDYRRFLELHAAVLLPLERWLEEAGVAQRLPDWHGRTRSLALRRDLMDLGVRWGPPQRLTYDNAASAMAGVLYVTEGSRLGGKVLAKRVMGTGAGLPTAFLQHGAGGGLWSSFLAWLERQPRDVAFAEGAVAAARNVFDRYFQEAQFRLTGCHNQSNHHG